MHSAYRARLTRRAEGVRFELTRPFGLPVFKTGAINRSATPPEPLRPTVEALYERRKLWEKDGEGHTPSAIGKLNLDSWLCSCKLVSCPGERSCLLSRNCRRAGSRFVD